MINLSASIGGTIAIMDYINNHPNAITQSEIMQLHDGSSLICSDITNDNDLSLLKSKAKEAPVVWNGWKRMYLGHSEWLMQSPNGKTYFVTD